MGWGAPHDGWCHAPDPGFVIDLHHLQQAVDVLGIEAAHVVVIVDVAW
jgi:hypothetical protein